MVSSPVSGGSAQADQHPTITPEMLESFDETSTERLARRLEEDDYPTPFAALSDWHLLRALAIHRPELTLPWLHLVDQEPFDED